MWVFSVPIDAGVCFTLCQHYKIISKAVHIWHKQRVISWENDGNSIFSATFNPDQTYQL